MIIAGFTRSVAGAALSVLMFAAVALFQVPQSFAEAPPEPDVEALTPAATAPRVAPEALAAQVEPAKPVHNQEEARPPAPVQPRPPAFPSPAERAEPRPETGMAVLNFSDASLKDILRTVADITKENFILAPGVSARISVQTTKPVPRKDVFGIFESILEVNGLSAVKTGSYYKIVPSPTAKQKGLEISDARSAAEIPPGDRMMNLVVPVEFASAGDLAQIIKPMLSAAGSIVNQPKANTLVITDTATNLKGYLDIIATLDVDAFKRMSIAIVPASNVDVKTLSKELSDILGALGLGKDSTQLAIVPLERLNSLVVFAAGPELLASVKEWVVRLDAAPAGEGQSINIYYVQNDKASNIKNLLDQLIGGKKPIASGAAPALANQPQATAAAAVTRDQARTEPGSEEIKIFIYEPNNAIVILSSRRDYQNLLVTIKELDRPPKQVLINALIAEVKLDEGTKYGVQWSALMGNVNIQQSTGIVSSVINNPNANIIAPIWAAAPTGLMAFATDASRFFAVIQAMASAGKVDVLSNPHIVVKNYEKASINVGSDEPVATQATQTAVTGTAGLVQTIEYRKTGVILTVSPQITEGGMVAMTIRQEVSDKSTDRTVGNALYPSFTKREAETSIVARDKETIVIGGLMQEKNDSTRTGVPLLSRIPILGSLFSFTSKTYAKTELVILLTASVLANPEQAATATDEFRKKVGGLKDLLEGK